MMQLDCPAQRLLINSLKCQIDVWKKNAASGKLSEADEADLQNDIGYAYTLLNDLESSFYNEFGFSPE